jgi:hypothetical protein
MFTTSAGNYYWINRKFCWIWFVLCRAIKNLLWAILTSRVVSCWILINAYCKTLLSWSVNVRFELYFWTTECYSCCCYLDWNKWQIFYAKKVLNDFTLCFRFEIVLKYVFFVFQDGTESRNIRISAESAFMLP